jgi:hypothetical protein
VSNAFGDRSFVAGEATALLIRDAPNPVADLAKRGHTE